MKPLDYAILVKVLQKDRNILCSYIFYTWTDTTRKISKSVWSGGKENTQCLSALLSFIDFNTKCSFPPAVALQVLQDKVQEPT